MIVEILAGLAVVLAVVALVAVFRRPAGGDADAQALRNDVNALRESSERSLSTITDVFSKQLQSVTSNVQTTLEGMTANVDRRLEAMNQNVAARLEQNARAMSTTSETVSQRIATVQGTFAELQKQVGELGGQAQQLGNLSRVVADLHQIFAAPKPRGGWGEAQLESLLTEVFAADQYTMQCPLGGEIADAVLKFPQGLVAIDSKFPLENFRKMIAADDDAKKALRRDFLKDVRGRIDEIAKRYIRPELGTLPFALAYIPAENVYYEAIIRDEDGNDLYSYCIAKRVLPVSPNSLYAYLQTIVVGLNGMRISKRAESILREIESLKIELGRFADDYNTVGKHIRNAGAKFDESAKQFGKVETRVQSLTGNGLPESEAKKAIAGE